MRHSRTSGNLSLTYLRCIMGVEIAGQARNGQRLQIFSKSYSASNSKLSLCLGSR